MAGVGKKLAVTNWKRLYVAAVIGSMSIGGSIIGSDNLAEFLQVSADSGAKKVLIPATDMAQLSKVPADLISKFSLLIYSDPIDAAFKAMGLG